MSRIKQLWWGVYQDFQRFRYGCDQRILSSLPLFAPYSSGSLPARGDLALQAAAQVFPFLSQLLDGTSGKSPLKVCTSTQFCADRAAQSVATQLKTLFDHYGSDKSRTHDYHLIYGQILSELPNTKKVVEIGLGTNNSDVVSTMGPMGKPGASLRAFRDHLNAAQIFGGDIDRRILFSEDRINTFFVDQTDPSSFGEIGNACGQDIDLIIDDGLHTVNARLAVMIFGLPRLKSGGWLVVEDISPASIAAWEVIGRVLPETMECTLIRALDGLVFAIRRKQA